MINLDRADSRGASFCVTSKGRQVLQLLERLNAAFTPGAP